MRGPGGITRRGFASLAAGALAACLCGCEAGSTEDHSGEWYIIDGRGEPAGTASFGGASSYGFASNGLAAAMDEKTGLWGFVDADGNFVIAAKYVRAKGFSSNGLAPVWDSVTDKWGYVNESGAWAIDPKYDNASQFRDDGAAPVVMGSEVLWIDTSGNEVPTPTQEATAVKDEGSGLYGIRGDDRSEWELTPTFPYLEADYHTSYFLAESQETGLCGVIDAGGEWVVEPAYADLVVAFDAGVLAAKDAGTGLWGYISWDGGWVVQPAFSDATRMGDDGRALARAA